MSIGHRLAMSLFLATAVAGCGNIDTNFCHVRDTVLRAAGGKETKTVVQLSIGPGLLLLGGAIGRCASKEASMLLDIRSVQVGIYELQCSGPHTGLIPASVERTLARRGYEPIVKVRDRGEETLVLAQLRKDRLKSLFVISADGRELVLVEVRGRLERVLEQAVRQRGLSAKPAIIATSAAEGH